MVLFLFCCVVVFSFFFFFPDNNYFHTGSIEEVLTKTWKNKDSLIQSRSCLQKNYQKLSLTCVKRGLKRNYHGLVLKNTKQVFPIPRWKSVLLVSSSENNYQKFLACSMDADFNRRKHTAYMYMAIAIIIFTKCKIIQKPKKHFYKPVLSEMKILCYSLLIILVALIFYCYISTSFSPEHISLFCSFIIQLKKQIFLQDKNAFQLSAFPRAGSTALPEKYTL